MSAIRLGDQVTLDVERLPDGAVRLVADPAGGEGVFAPGVWERLLSLSAEDVAAMRAATGPWPPATVVDLRRTCPVVVVPDIDAAHVAPGSVEVRAIDGVVLGYAYRCPGCGESDWIPIGADATEWRAAPGDPARPESVSLTPSILHTACGWHGYLVNGRFSPC